MAGLLTRPTSDCFPDVRAEVAGTISQLAWVLGQRLGESVKLYADQLAEQLGGGELVERDVWALREAVANLLHRADCNQDAAEAPPAGEVLEVAEDEGSYEPDYVQGDGGPATE